MSLDILGVNSHITTGLGIKNYVWDHNSDVENENITTNFSWQIQTKKQKSNFFFTISRN